MSKTIYLMDVIGAFGDSLCSEPVVRYAIRNLKDADVRIMTNHPQIFRHFNKPMGVSHEELGLTGVPFVHLFNRFEMIMEGGQRGTHRIIEHAPPLLVESINFISMLMLRRTLPDADKKISVPFEDTTEKLEKMIGGRLENLTLLHVGSAAAEKIRLFPENYCDDLVTLLEKDGPIALIGKTNEHGGGWVKPRNSWAIDLVDKLTWDDFLTVISKAKLLITNDSAPVHAASMFDNWLIVLPTIRHPDRLIHPRKGHRYYKALALYQKLVLDDATDIPVDKFLTHCNWGDQENFREEYLAAPAVVAEYAKVCKVTDFKIGGINSFMGEL